MREKSFNSIKKGSGGHEKKNKRPEKRTMWHNNKKKSPLDDQQEWKSVEPKIRRKREDRGSHDKESPVRWMNNKTAGDATFFFQKHLHQQKRNPLIISNNRRYTIFDISNVHFFPPRVIQVKGTRSWHDYCMNDSLESWQKTSPRDIFTYISWQDDNHLATKITCHKSLLKTWWKGGMNECSSHVHTWRWSRLTFRRGIRVLIMITVMLILRLVIKD